MAQAKARRVDSFVVRFYGGMSRDPAEFRGQVEHVQSGERRVFQGINDLVRAMEEFAQREGENRLDANR